MSDRIDGGAPATPRERIAALRALVERMTAAAIDGPVDDVREALATLRHDLADQERRTTDPVERRVLVRLWRALDRLGDAHEEASE